MATPDDEDLENTTTTGEAADKAPTVKPQPKRGPQKRSNNMARDNQGNDLSAVETPVTGFAAWNPDATSVPTLDDLTYGSLPDGYRYFGLFTEDGGYTEEAEEGDEIKFFQQGYTLKGGDDSISGSLTLAESTEDTRLLLGFTTGSEGIRESTAYAGQFGLILATRMKSGKVMLRGGLATIGSANASQETRGEMTTYEVSFNWAWQAETGHYRFKVVEPAA